MEKRNLFIGIGLVILLVALPFAWYLGSPLFIDKTVNEELPASSGNAEVGDGSNSGGESNESMDEPLMSLYSGDFVDADGFHKTSGKVSVLELEGKKYLRFEDFQTTNGPDLKVYLSTDTGAGDYVSLGDLKGNIGNQNYELSEDVDLEKYDKVLIWCEAFSTLFGSAELN